MLKISDGTMRAFVLISNFLATDGLLFTEEQHAQCQGDETFNDLCFCESELMEDLKLFKMACDNTFEVYFNNFPKALNMRLDLFQKRLDELPQRILYYVDLRLEHTLGKKALKN